ncbi:MAG: hypothetical protein JSV33_14800 [bacterium]|nr:MAG: hypothetical protein JSV33_14800 [bacterium]
MVPSLEVRWFREGTAPDEVLEWFLHGEPVPGTPETRTDCYLRTRCGGSLGLKLREGRIEVKQRQHRFGERRFHETVWGEPELWYKWSYELADPGEPFLEPATGRPLWIAVRKRRWLRRYRIAGDGSVGAVEAGRWCESGCELEFTTIEVGDGRWWTIGFEAYGGEEVLQDNLLLVAEHVFSAAEPPAFDSSHSFGFPFWLERLVI